MPASVGCHQANCGLKPTGNPWTILQGAAASELRVVKINAFVHTSVLYRDICIRYMSMVHVFALFCANKVLWPAYTDCVKQRACA